MNENKELKNDVKETHNQIYDCIEQANQQLQSLFNKREEELLKLYKKEMLNVQRQLVQIRDEESQTEIEKRIQKYREELAQEREQYLEKSIKLSENVKQLSQLDRDIRNSFKELQGEIKFLDEQLVYADKHYVILQEELTSLGEPTYQQKTNQQQLQSIRYMQLPEIKRSQHNENTLQFLQSQNQKLKEQIAIAESEEVSEIEKCFDEILLNEQSDASTTVTSIDLTCCDEFTEYQKRRIFEQFLEKPYSRGKIPKCQICDKKFSLTAREHQCKRCLRAVCESCAQFKTTHVKKDGKESSKPHRMCKICKEESDSIKSFVDSNKLVYGVDTLAKQWLGKNLNGQEYKSARESTKIKMEKTEISGLDNINYSLKEFYFYVGKDNTKLQNVCMTFISKNPEVQFTPELVCLTNFLLCFASESTTYQLLNIIYKQKPPDDVNRAVLTICVKGYNLQEDDRQLMGQFLMSRLKRYLLTYSINMFCFDTTLHLITQLINKYESFIKSLGTIFMLASKQLKSSTHEDMELWILRNIRRKEVENLLQQMQLPQKKQEQQENREPSQSIRSIAFSMIEPQDQNLLSDLRAEIANLKLQLALKENEIESYKFQLSQTQSPDDQKKDKYIQQKNDEIAILLSRVDSLTAENQTLIKRDASVQNQNAIFKDQQKLIDEQQRQIEKLKAKIKDNNFENRAMSMSLASGNMQIMSGKEVQELKQKHEEEIKKLQEQCQSLEQGKNQLQRIVESQKQLNQRVVDYISSMTINTNTIEISVKPLERMTKNDNDDIKYIIDTKNQQNQLLKQLLAANQQQIQDLNSKLKDIKSMIYSS